MDPKKKEALSSQSLPSTPSDKKHWTKPKAQQQQQTTTTTTKEEHERAPSKSQPPPKIHLPSEDDTGEHEQQPTKEGSDEQPDERKLKPHGDDEKKRHQSMSPLPKKASTAGVKKGVVKKLSIPPTPAAEHRRRLQARSPVVGGTRDTHRTPHIHPAHRHVPRAELKGAVSPKKEEPSLRAGEIKPPSEPEEKERRQPGEKFCIRKFVRTFVRAHIISVLQTTKKNSFSLSPSLFSL
jgi:hypothetical protein